LENRSGEADCRPRAHGARCRLAEDLAQDALVAALEQWPESGIPDNPGAWLMATAKRRAIDHFPCNHLLDRKHKELGRDLEIREMTVPDFDSTIDDKIGDDLLRLIFTACHPVLSTEARLALTLRLLGGLTTDEIARAFLVPEPTVAQRIVRAKRALAEAHIPFEVLAGPSLPRVCRLSCKSSTLFLTKATRQPPATTGCGRRCVTTRCGSDGSSPS
jgi:RNA polymerase sigma factor (sigma-70 family)